MKSILIFNKISNGENHVKFVTKGKTTTALINMASKKAILFFADSVTRFWIKTIKKNNNNTIGNAVPITRLALGAVQYR